ncbi:MAG: formylglycine-generating enzyme family protein, partial [Spirochaetaceae bacterium]|nr:formylglycine-generating enzyme family protein [Spirochaetaceae bacterium]
GNLFKMKARNIFVMLDTCKAGALEAVTSAVDRAWGDLAQNKNLAILMAAAGDQFSIESQEEKQGVLTWAVLQALKERPPAEPYVAVNRMMDAAQRKATEKAGQIIANQAMAVSENIANARAEAMSVPAGTVATKGWTDLESFVQEPVAKSSRENFNLFDLDWPPAEVTVNARTAGQLTIQGEDPEKKLNLEAGKNQKISLRKGTYKFTMNYRAQVAPEDREETFQSGESITVAFTGIPEKPIVAPAGFIHIPGGTFIMGSPAAEEHRSANEMQRSVQVSGFFIAKHEVTQKEYTNIMRTNPSGFRGDNLPVETVSWFDAVRYCNERSRREGLVPAYTINGTNVTWNRNANGYRLPTEAEWEYACRAGNSGPYSVSRASFMKDIRDRGTKTNTVGSVDPNPWGLYDMHGNVWEWCWDWFGPYAAGRAVDPVGPASGTLRTQRGGSWLSVNAQIRSAYRGSSKPDYKDDSLGFRLARSLPQR